MANNDGAHDVLAFWFGDEPDDRKMAAQQGKLWWSKNDLVDRDIRERFELLVRRAATGELDGWAETPAGLLALIVLLDQFPRNIYRGRPEAFGFDEHALRWVLQGLERGVDRALRPVQRVFFYLPLEHSESIENQDRSLALYEQLLRDVPADQRDTFDGFRDYARRHRDVIVRFGRFPHRNAILGRASTDEEIAFLKTPGSSF